MQTYYFESIAAFFAKTVVIKVVTGSKKEKAPMRGFSNLLILLSFLAGAAGFEPATYGFGDRRSTS